MHILLFFLSLILIFIFIGLYIISKAVNGFSNLFKTKKRQPRQPIDEERNLSNYAHSTGKIFKEDEGEYIDFEEKKED
ncbi:MAG: DUF4834 family protein [Phocaeicola sp.]|uniref:DUF4834 family protein n=1 Tax=Phocaeicola TaxID=909656 RepID=UPI00234F440E|nr:DUF4834 family protein [Phocaeicola oris]MCE2616864.1 DUF4834 family protein [Phocaeicola oris]